MRVSNCQLAKLKNLKFIDSVLKGQYGSLLIYNVYNLSNNRLLIVNTTNRENDIGVKILGSGMSLINVSNIGNSYCKFVRNGGDYVVGGGIFITGNRVVLNYNCQFISNLGLFGAGLHLSGENSVLINHKCLYMKNRNIFNVNNKGIRWGKGGGIVIIRILGFLRVRVTIIWAPIDAHRYLVWQLIS